MQTCIGPSEERVSMAGICCGYSDNLLLRAADVTIKEGQPLVLAVPRQSFIGAETFATSLEEVAAASGCVAVCSGGFR